MMTAGSVQPRAGVTQYQARDGTPVFLSDMIIELGLAETAHVEAAVETARSSGETVGRILVREGRLTEDQLARALAARYGLSHIDLNEFEVDPDAANLLPPAAAARYKAVPVAFEMGGGLLVAMADPSDSLAISDIAFMTRLDVQAAVAGADLIQMLVASLPLPPNETRGPAFTEHSVPPAPEPIAYEQQAYPPAPDPSIPAPRTPDPTPDTSHPTPQAVDTAELDALRAEIEQLNSLIDSERSKHAEMVAELKQQVSGDESLRSELDGARHDLEGARNELDGARHELEATRQERDQARGDLDHTRGELDHTRGELETARGELDTARGELETMRGELGTARGELETMRGELEQAREAAARAADAESRLGELEDAEQRIAEAHSTLERMRNEFELERETHATTERDLRARLASETERREALDEAQAALQKRVDVLRTQNAALLDAYATAKRWSAEFARGARELAATLEQPVLDDAVRGQQSSPEKDKADADDSGRDSGRFTREDGEQPPEGGGGATPPNWFS